MTENETKYEGMIYRCTHIDTGRCYIGQSSTGFEKRKREHLLSAKNNRYKYHNIKFHNYLRKYGESAFEWDIVCVVSAKPKKKLKEGMSWLEMYYIQEFDSFHNGMNSTLGGESTLGRKHGDKTKAKIGAKAKGRKLSDEHKKAISIGGKGKGMTGKKHKPESITQMKLSKAVKYEGENNKNAIAISQYNTKGILIAEWGCMRVAGDETGVDTSSICECCRGHAKTAGGYVWRYKGDTFDKYNHINNKIRQVKQYTLDSKHIKDWDSITCASNYTGISKSSISYSCNGKYKTAGGFLWEYLED